MWRIWAIVAIAAAVVGFLGWTAIKVFPQQFSEMARKVERLEHQIKLRDSKIAAYQRAQDRRDAAVKASPCRAQIEFWIKNPDRVPGAQSQFRHPLTIPESEKAPAPHNDWSGPMVNWSKLNPLNWF